MTPTPDAPPAMRSKTMRYRHDIGAYSHFVAIFDGDTAITEEEAAQRLNDQDVQIAALRLALDEAHHHIGALLGSEGNTMSVKQAARAWLRRGA